MKIETKSFEGHIKHFCWEKNTTFSKFFTCIQYFLFSLEIQFLNQSTYTQKEQYDCVNFNGKVDGKIFFHAKWISNHIAKGKGKSDSTIKLYWIDIISKDCPHKRKNTKWKEKSKRLSLLPSFMEAGCLKSENKDTFNEIYLEMEIREKAIGEKKSFGKLSEKEKIWLWRKWLEKTRVKQRKKTDQEGGPNFSVPIRKNALWNFQVVKTGLIVNLVDLNVIPLTEKVRLLETKDNFLKLNLKWIESSIFEKNDWGIQLQNKVLI